MTSNNDKGAIDQQSQHLDLFVVAFSAIAGFLGTFDRYGVAGGLFFTSILFFGVWAWTSLRALSQSQGKWPKWIEGFVSLSRGSNVYLFYLGIGTLLLASALVASDIAEARWTRQRFTLHHPNIPIENSGYVADLVKLRHNLIGNQSQQGDERRSFDVWCSWMKDGADSEKVVNLPDGGQKSVKTRLAYIESAPFDGDYTTIHTDFTVTASLRIKSGIAFLKRDWPTDATAFWQTSSSYRPEYRQTTFIPESTGTSANILIAEPEIGERLIVFYVVETTHKDSILPKQDQIIPSAILRVHK